MKIFVNIENGNVRLVNAGSKTIHKLKLRTTGGEIISVPKENLGTNAFIIQYDKDLYEQLVKHARIIETAKQHIAHLVNVYNDKKGD